ncbi:MAG: 30S ribosomal protein S2 [Bacteroidia bacterium]|jgi:small subunit ribosomal protein S2|nr:30S ribosomal protein S2 [Bacteroidia bacterium]
MSSRTTFNELLESGAHFGHLKSKWNPAMAPYIYAEKNGIHIIDLNKSIVKIDEAANGLKQIARSGRKILFVATKKQAKDIVSEKVKTVNMPYVTERWPGGMLTNFATIRKSVRRMTQIDKMFADGTFSNISKRERLQFSRERAKLETQFGSVADLTRLPAALFIVDITKEHIAIAEAKRLNIPTFAIVDTNSNPNEVDFAIPANDDASTSIAYIVDLMVNAVKEGLSERKMDKENNPEEGEGKEGASDEFNEGAFETSEEETEEKGGVKKRRRVAAKK